MALEIIESSQTKTVWSTKRCVIVAAISLILGSILFVLAYIGMKQNTGIGALNEPILSWMISQRSPQTTDIMKTVTDFANPLIFTAIISVAAGLWVVIKREVWRPILLIGSVGTAAGLATILKTITMNSRPTVENMIPPLELDYSFPSGHTIVIAVFILALGYLLYSRRSSVKRIFGWVTATIIITGMVAISRLYLGYHWLTDIVASVGLGLIILATVIIIDLIVDRHFNN